MIVLVLSLALADPIKLGTFSIDSPSAGGGTMHFSEKVVLSIQDDFGTRKTTMEMSQGGLPLFTRAFKIEDSMVIALGWRSGGGGTDSHVAWLISLAQQTPTVLDTIELAKPRSGASLGFNDKTGQLAFFFDGDCPGADGPVTAVRSQRGIYAELCRQPLKQSGGWSVYSDTPAVKASTSLRVLVSVKGGAFVHNR